MVDSSSTKERMRYVAIGLAILVVIGITFFSQLRPKEAPSVPSDSSVSEIEPVPLSTLPSTPGYRTYANEQYGFAFSYPEELSATSYAERNGGTTLVFQNQQSVLGFQIYIIPYAEDSVSDEQFRKDIPSGVRENVRNITLDGAIAALFTSRDTFLGKTTEVWVLNDGYLIEITTAAALEPALLDVLATWSFR